MKQSKNRTIIKLTLSIFILVFVCLFGNMVSAATIERTYTIPTSDNQVPIGGSKLFWVQVSGIDSNAVITNVEAKFDYIAYGVVQNYVSSRFNRASDPGSSGGQVLVSQGSLPAGNPGTYGYKSFPTSWDGLGVNSNYYFRFSLASSSPYTCTIKKLYVRITYSVPWIDVTYPNGGETLTKGQNYTINWTSSNVSGNVLIHLYKGSSHYSTIAASTSKDGSYYPFNPSISLPDASDYQICMSAMSGTVSNCSENFTIQSPPKPDLVVQNQSASPTTVEAGSSTYISCTVKNQGSGSAASSYIKYYLSSNTTYDTGDTYFTSDYVSSLSSGGTNSENATVTIPSGTSTGIKYILFYADKDGSVSESNENNNVAYKAITVIDPVNPQVNVSPTTGPQGTTFTETGSGFTKNSTATLYFDRPGLGVITLPVNTEPDGTFTNPWLCDDCPIGTYSYWAVDDTTNKTSNTVTFTVYAINPQVNVSPSSGPQGTTFQQPGTGFTRNSTVTLHFTGPDGSSTDNENTDGNGAYSHSWLCDQCPVGTYSYYAVDDTTEQTSNTVYFTVTSDSPVFVPFYRLYKYEEPNNTRDHFYTTNLTERDNAVNTMGYVDEGIECYVSNRSFPGGVPLFRLYKGDANSHFYTTSETEKDIKIIEGYVYEGIQCFVNHDPAEGLTSLHRLKQETGTQYHYFLSAKTHEGDTSNPSFMLNGGEGIIVYAKHDKEITFTSVLCSTLDLKPGFNLIGFSCPVYGYSAYQLLNELGSGNVSSIQRYSTENGCFETAAFGPDSQPAGVDFLIVPGEGYFIFMKQKILGFQ